MTMATHSVEVPEQHHPTGEHDHHAGEHPAHLAHHFDSMAQQFAAGKLGMWIFLVTEILFFGGLFCAYAVYRANHPEVFVYAHHFLDKNLGALNTAILIFSSFTMAWAVRAAQLGQQQTLRLCLITTLLCAGAFLGVKYVEYRQKWEHGLLWAGWYHPHVTNAEHHGDAAPKPSSPATAPTAAQATTSGQTPEPTTAATAGEHSEYPGEPRLAGVFFSIYFCMTGLHALHVVGGMIAITWLLIRAFQGVFGPEYYGPVDYVGLYWHLVDMIWIYLFPLLYLIH